MKGPDAWAALEAGETAELAVRARWLEDRLVGLDLAPVIDELAMIADAAPERVGASPQSVRSWLGPDTTAVLEQGLGRLPARKLEELFRRPGLLPALQELVLTEGGAHWNARVRANASTRALAARHRPKLIRRLGLDGRGDEDADPTSEDGLAVESSRVLPLVSRPGRGAMRTALLLVPLAAAAAILTLIVPGVRGPERPVEPAMEKTDRLVIVRADLPADESAPVDPRSAAPGGWPAHPWESLATVIPVPKPSAANPPGETEVAVSRDWLVGSRDWAKRLEETSNLSPAQVRAAAARARAAVTAVEALAASGGSGLGNDAQSRLEATCRKAVVELDRLQSLMKTPPSDEQGLTRAKQAILRTLGEIEVVLGEMTVAAGEAAGDAAEPPAGGPRP